MQFKHWAQAARRLAWLGMPLLLAACGGAGSDDQAGTRTGGPSAALAPQASISYTSYPGTAQLLSPDTLFSWAELKHQQLFPVNWSDPFDAPDQWTEGIVYRRYYPSGNYIGVLGQDVYLYGPVSGGGLSRVGTLASVGCSLNPGACSPAAPDGSLLFMQNLRQRGAITVMRNSSPAAGKALQGELLSVQGGYGSNGNMAYDAQTDRLFLPLNPDTEQPGIGVLDNVSTARGTHAPSRTIVPDVPNSMYVDSLFYDGTADRLYAAVTRRKVASVTDGYLAVFEHAGTLSGRVVPNRLITFSSSPRTFTIDTVRSIGYFSAGSGFAAIDQIHLANGPSVFSRSVIYSAGRHPAEGIVSVTSLAVDAGRDRLYFTSAFAGVHAVDRASSAAGSNYELKDVFAGAPQAETVTVDPRTDRLYLSAYTDAYIVNGASRLAEGGLPDGSVKLAGGRGLRIGNFAFK